MNANQVLSSQATTCTIRIPDGIGPEILRAVIDAWPVAGEHPVLVSTRPVADSNPPTTGDVETGPTQPGGSWITVQCMQSTDLFQLVVCNLIR